MAQQTITGGNGTTGQTGEEVKDIMIVLFVKIRVLSWLIKCNNGFLICVYLCSSVANCICIILVSSCGFVAKCICIILLPKAITIRI